MKSIFVNHRRGAGTVRPLVLLLFVCYLLFSPVGTQQADAQLFKKIFKKKAKTERKSSSKSDGIDDALQVPLADITATADNSNNRNAFLGIPVGLKAERFEKLLLEQGFRERKAEGKQTGKSYIYDGTVYGEESVVTLAVSEQTERVYAVDVAEVAVYPSEQAVAKRFQTLRGELVKVYGRGYVDNQGEAYTIQSRLGTVSLHYERGMMSGSYTIGFALDDAKAYQMAYQEMEDKEYETAPRTIEGGLAAACRHTDLVGLGVKLLQNRTVSKSQSVLRQYDYTLGKANAKVVPATFAMDDYKATVSLARRKQTVTAITITAADDADAVRKDLGVYGFTSDDQKVYRQGKMTATVTADKQGRVVLVMK